MKVEEAMGTMSEEARSRLATCATRSEAEAVLAQEVGSPLDDEVLDTIAGGMPYVRSPHEIRTKLEYEQGNGKIC